ncbi:MAG: helix-turn-helix transcriptional regulator [Brachymonas sp.]|nr:helix-turn-helix transcriptional regulator [Brachymonas sp.]
MHADSLQNDLIDRIYECSFVPEGWPAVLDELASLVQARGGQLFAVRDKVMNWTTSASLTEVFHQYVSQGYFARCGRKVCLFSNHQPSFLAEQDYWTPEQIEANEIYREFFRPNGLGWSASTGLAMPTQDNIVFTLERNLERGPMEREKIDLLNALRPHLARAALIAARLGLRSAQGASDTLATMGLPTVVLDEDGQVVLANDLMTELQDMLHWRAGNRVALADGQANAMLWAAWPQLKESAPSSGESIHSFVLRGKEGLAAKVVHVLPIRRARMIFLRVRMPCWRLRRSRLEKRLRWSCSDHCLI